MSRRSREDTAVLSLDSFLDIVTNVVGVLILVAVVTVLGAGDIGVSAGASALTAPRPSAARLLFECSGDEVFFVDEEGNAERIKNVVQAAQGEAPITGEAVVALLDGRDIGDQLHRVRAELTSEGITWVYSLRPGVRGEAAPHIESPRSSFQRRLDDLPATSFVYFVVHDDSFEVFQKARDIARARGIAVGWHPVEGKRPLRLSGIGSLGKRIQ